MPAGMMFEITYFSSYYQSWGQIFLDSHLDKRIDLAYCIYFLCFRHLSHLNGERLIIVSMLPPIISSAISHINFQFAVKLPQAVSSNCKPTCKTINHIVLHYKRYKGDICRFRLICFIKCYRSMFMFLDNFRLLKRAVKL